MSRGDRFRARCRRDSVRALPASRRARRAAALRPMPGRQESGKAHRSSHMTCFSIGSGCYLNTSRSEKAAYEGNITMIEDLLRVLCGAVYSQRGSMRRAIAVRYAAVSTMRRAPSCRRRRHGDQRGDERNAHDRRPAGGGVCHCRAGARQLARRNCGARLQNARAAHHARGESGTARGRDNCRLAR